MDTLKAILSRRSIRIYTGKVIPAEYYDILLKAAMQAPSARNRQPWHFIMISDKIVLNRLADSNTSWRMLAQADRAIVVCGDSETEDTESFLIQDCAAATQNLLLAAFELGLGAVWLGVHPREDRVAEIRKALSLPARITPVSMISVGFPDEDRQVEDRYIPERVHSDRW
jgi:nitroreductase